MDVRCPQCQTLYELDDAQVRRKAVTLKCSQCQHVFRLETRSAVSQENQRRWMVRRKDDGDILYLNTFDVLHEWIMKQEVQGDDEISRTGDSWATLGEIGEFLPMFHVVASITALEGDPVEEANPEVSSIAIRVPERSESKTPGSRPKAKQKPHRERVRTAIQFGGEQPATRPEPMRTEEITKRARPSQVTPHDLPPGPGAADSADEQPAAASRSGELGARLDMSQEMERPNAPAAGGSGGSRGIIAFVGVIAVFGIGAYFFVTGSDMLKPEPAPPDVVTIGEAADAGEAAPDPTVLVGRASAVALEAVRQENDAIWTLWHDTASKPFYVALDTAYAAADEASVGVEVDEILKRARVSLENGKLIEANRGFRVVLAKDGANPAAVTGLGWTLLAQGHADQAAQQFLGAMKLDENYGDAYIGLGSAYRNLGEYRKAYNAYDLYLGRFPRGDKASIASYQMDQLRKQLGL